MEILFIVNWGNLFHVSSGCDMRNNLFAEALSEIGHVDIISFRQDELAPNIANCDVIFSKYIVDSHNYFDFIRSLICMTISPNNPYSYYRTIKQKSDIIDSFIKKKEYDIIACRYVEPAIRCGLLKYREKLVIDADDNPANTLKYWAARASFAIIKWKKLYESKKIGRMVSTLFNSILCSFCSNKSESLSPQTIYLPNTSIIKGSAPDSYEPTVPRILFVGWLDFFPNTQGITHFVETIFPSIRSTIPLAELRIVGNGQQDFLDYLNKKDGVKAVGRVDDITNEYREAAIVIIPIYNGSGTSLKFIEALQMNRPVISTPVGTRGFDDTFQDGIHYLLARNDREFVEKTINVLSNVSKSREMAKNGFEMAKRLFSKENFIETVTDSLSKIKH